MRTSVRLAMQSVILLSTALAVCAGGSAAQTQQLSPVPVPVSELGQENLSLVAASAADLKAVLLKDPGLMVELKRWVANEATNQGQLITEADLSNDAVFNRLESDVKFRAIATQLMQRYGYLVPKVDPDSAAGKEQELLVQERARWIAQDEEQQRVLARQKAQEQAEAALACTAPAQNPNAKCNAAALANPQQTPVSTPQNPVTASPVNALPAQPLPANPPTYPAPGTSPSIERTQLTLGADQTGGLSSSSPFPSSTGLGGFSNGGLGGLGGSSASSSSDDQGLSAFASGLGSMTGNPPGNSSDAVAAAMASGMFPGLGTNSLGSSSSLAGANSQPMMVMLSPNPGKPMVQPAELMRAPNPYNDIPSLYDMYLQAQPRPAVPARFGAEIFANGTRDLQSIPMDLPAGPDYVVGPGDGLAIDMWGGVSQRFYQTVDREGRVSVPEVGPVLVSGKSLAQVQQALQQALRTQFRDESADVSLSRLRTVRIYEVGDVARPGAYDVSSLSTPLNALFAAGGPTPSGSLRLVKHYRGNQLLETVDLYDLLLHGVKGDMQGLQDGDTILVPAAGAQVTVEGMVRRPAIYELNNEKELASVLDLAGGLLPTATLRHIEVQRLMAHEKQTMLSLDLPEDGDSAEVSAKLAAFQVQDGDRIRVFPIAQGNVNAVYLQGHVVRPGRYAYHAEMRVTDVIGSYKDLLPEPASQYAEIIRLNAPDFHPTVESFDLAGALADPAHAPLLQPMDTVRVFSRFDFENPPTVSVLGAVRGPGTYRTSGQIHLSDAVHLAGGLTPEAQTDDAQIFRYLADGKTTIFSVSLAQALEGDPTQNILLTSRDRVIIHRSPQAEQPAVAYVQGAVGKPGRYPLTANMTVADLIRVGGGLQPSADRQSADLTRYDWNGGKLTGKHDDVELAAALGGDNKADLPLHNGDVVTIRQVPGWNDLGASISVQGEVAHPGTYGIQPGERLSSVLQRAGGFLPAAYPYGAVLQRTQVRELESKQQDQMILRVKDAEGDLELLPDNDPKTKQAKQAALAQYQATLTQLTATAPVGRVAIRISGKLKDWRNTAADIEVRAGDTLVIPKRPDYVMVDGQVFNATAVSYRPGRSAKWYLSQSGGPTALADKKSIFVIRADGSIVSSKKSLWGGDSLSATLRPGDTVMVPEKAVGGGPNWQNLFTAAQVASSVASTVFIALRY